MKFLDALKEIKEDEKQVTVIVPEEGQKVVKIISVEDDSVILEAKDGTGRYYLHYTSVYLVAE